MIRSKYDAEGGNDAGRPDVEMNRLKNENFFLKTKKKFTESFGWQYVISYPVATGLKHFIEVTILPTWLILLHRWLLPEFSHLIQPISKVRWVCILFYGVEFTHRIEYTRHITVALCISPCFFILCVFTHTHPTSKLRSLIFSACS